MYYHINIYFFYLKCISHILIRMSKLLRVLSHKKILSYTLCTQGALIYISPMLNNRSVKLLTIYITLHIPLHNIFIKKEKYHEFQFYGIIINFFCNIIFELQEYYITSLLGQNIFLENKYVLHVFSLVCTDGNSSR